VLFGRDADVRAVAALVAVHRLVTLVGAGGIGKSRLAQAAAHALMPGLQDGAWMVELAGLSDPALLPTAVAQALAIPLPGQQSLTDELIARIDQRQLLLALDNCEHLLDSAAELVHTILRRAPGITSRRARNLCICPRSSNTGCPRWRFRRKTRRTTRAVSGRSRCSSRACVRRIRASR
jgi:predicted ATPase